VWLICEANITGETGQVSSLQVLREMHLPPSVMPSNLCFLLK